MATAPAEPDPGGSTVLPATMLRSLVYVLVLTTRSPGTSRSPWPAGWPAVLACAPGPAAAASAPATPTTVTNAAMPVLGRISPPLSGGVTCFRALHAPGTPPVHIEPAVVVRKASSRGKKGAISVIC